MSRKSWKKKKNAKAKKPRASKQTRNKSTPQRPDESRAHTEVAALQDDFVPVPFIYQLRIDLKGAKPPIWRRVEVHSDLPLDVLHRVIQAVFEWDDTHLHRFSVGGGAHWPDARKFLSPYDVQNPDVVGEDVGDTPEVDVRLDEVLQKPGDILRYMYDFGDGWDHQIKLEKILDRGTGGIAPDDAPFALVTGGRRAAPPEDCGALLTEEELSGVLEDPTHFDVDEANALLLTGTIGEDFQQALAADPDMLDGLVSHYPGIGALIAASGDSLTTMIPVNMLYALEEEPELPLSPEETTESLSGITALLTTIADAGTSGLQLTGDREITVDVAAALQDELPNTDMDDILAAGGTAGFHLTPVLDVLEDAGLVRTQWNVATLTPSGAEAKDDPEALWAALVTALAPSPELGADADDGRSISQETSALVLLSAAVTGLPAEEYPVLADVLNGAGWGTTDPTTGEPAPVGITDLLFITPVTIFLGYIARPEERDWAPTVLSEAASCLGREAILASRQE